MSAETHIRYLDAPVRRVLSLIPAKYDDMWTGAKGFYKVEPIVADGGQVVLYAPHIREIATTHPEIEQIGYHCRDYFVKQWDRFRDQHWGDLAHSTHLRGRRNLGRGQRRTRPGHGHPGHRHPRGCHPRDQPRLPRPGRGRPRRVGRRPGHARRARRRRGPLPPEVNPASRPAPPRSPPRWRKRWTRRFGARKAGHLPAARKLRISRAIWRSSRDSLSGMFRRYSQREGRAAIGFRGSYSSRSYQ